MKKEVKEVAQELETVYQLDKYPQTEYAIAMKKEFRKYIDKLARIAKYEENMKEGKELTKEMMDLISNKAAHTTYLDTLKKAMDIYMRSTSEAGSEKEIKTDMKKEVKKDSKKKKESVAPISIENIAYLLVLGSALAFKDKSSVNPFTTASCLSPEEQGKLFAAFSEIARFEQDRSTTLSHEVTKCTSLLQSLLLPSLEATNPKIKELLEIIEKAIKNKALMETQFKIGEKTEPKNLLPQQNVANVSIQSGVLPEVKTKPKESPVPISVPISVPAPAPISVSAPHTSTKANAPTLEEKKEEAGKWSQLDDDEEDDHKEKSAGHAPQVESEKPAEYVPAHFEEEEEDQGFTIAGEEKTRGSTGNRSRRGRGRRYYRGDQGERGYSRGERRGRGAYQPRGEYPSRSRRAQNA